MIIIKSTVPNRLENSTCCSRFILYLLTLLWKVKEKNYVKNRTTSRRERELLSSTCLLECAYNSDCRTGNPLRMTNCTHFFIFKEIESEDASCYVCAREQHCTQKWRNHMAVRWTANKRRVCAPFQLCIHTFSIAIDCYWCMFCNSCKQMSNNRTRRSAQIVCSSQYRCFFLPCFYYGLLLFYHSVFQAVSVSVCVSLALNA